MIEISHFFEKFKHLLNSDAGKRQAISEAVFEFSKVRIDPEKITVRNAVAHMPLSPIMRTEIIMKKRPILDRLKEKGIVVTDIR